jgi:hypothetical protein
MWPTILMTLTQIVAAGMSPRRWVAQTRPAYNPTIETRGNDNPDLAAMLADVQGQEPANGHRKSDKQDSNEGLDETATYESIRLMTGWGGGQGPQPGCSREKHDRDVPVRGWPW